ncbi:MAG: 50S ribosomal protein L18 [Patescibacteria group bacterium]|nr:50S ribosomal protein L18 [Patescibacteria group bacterium]
MLKKQEKRQRRQIHIRAKVKGTEKCPRLSVFRSNKYIYAQLIDDVNGKTLVSANNVKIDKKDGLNKIEKAKEIGSSLAKKAIDNKITKIVFDRGGYKYHGRVKAIAEGAREGGLKF